MSDDAPPPASGGRPADLARAALAKAKQQAKDRGRQPGEPARRTTADQRRRRPRPSGGYSGAGPDDLDPQLVASTIGELVADRGWERTSKAAKVLACWPDLVGPEIAAHSSPESLAGGELVVVAESTAWATQLRLLTRTISERITAEMGPGLVTKIHVRGPTAPDWRRGPRRVVGRGPRDTYG